MTLDEAIEWLKGTLIRPALSPFAKCESNQSRISCAKLLNPFREFEPTAYVLFLDKYGEPVLCDCTELTPTAEVCYNFIPVENIKAAFRGSSSWRQSTWYLNAPPVIVADWYRDYGWMPG